MRKFFPVLIIFCLVISLCACTAEESSAETQSVQTDTPEAAVSETTAISSLADLEAYYGTTFGQGEVIDVNVEITEDNWEDILDNAEDEEYHSANITVNGTTVNNVGFRTKGFSSLNSVASSDSDRYGFKVKLDEYVDGQTLNGLDMFVLNGSFSDPSYMREYLTYAASAYLGCDTPDITYCNLYINGELFGFYLMIESYDDSFVERYTDSEDTVLYKAESESCTLLTNDDASGFDVQYGEDEGNTNITKLITVLNNTTAENKEQLESILDIDSVLKAIAINTVTGNYDSYSGSKAHNYYLLYSEGKFSYLGWDYNMSMGGFSEDGGASVTADVSSPVYGVDISSRPLIEKLLAIEEYNEKYLAYVDSLTEYFSDFQTTVNAIADEIRTFVENDPSAFYTTEQFEANIVASDANLSELEGKTGFGGNMQGERPDNSDTDAGAERPDFQNGEGQGGGQRPDSQNADTENMTPSSDMPSQVIGGAGGNMGGNNLKGGSISSEAVSIVDYITQRLENIESQLSA